MVLVILCLGLLTPFPAHSDPPANAFRFLHDADGRLKAAIDPEIDAAVYSWDAAGNLLSISRQASSKLSIIQLSPAHGEVGATVRVEGTGFSTTPASNTVKFNGTAATVSTASATALTVKVPSGVTTGPVTVAVGEEAPVASPESFTVTASTAPSISSLSPSVAASGEEVTISGSNFEPSVSGNAVVFNGMRPEVTSASASSIKFKVPPDRLGGLVSVGTSSGSSTGPDLFVPPAGVTVAKVGTTSRLSLGNVNTAEFSGSEKSTLLLFDGQAGESASFSLSEATIGGSISIWAPNGSQVSGGSASFSKGGASVFAGPVTLPSSGTYTILLSPSGSGSGTVKVVTYGFKDATGTLDPPASAEGVKQSVSITSPGQVGRYSVEMKAGDKVSLRTDNSNMTGGYEIRWVNPSGSSVYSVGFAAKENWFWDSKTFSTAGTWTLVVDPNGANTGSVDLTLWETPDKTGQTITPSTEGGSVTSTISLPGQRELVTFSGAKDQKVSWNTSESTISAGGTISILKPNGAELSGSAGSFGFHDAVTLPEAGTYAFVIDPAGTGLGSVTNGTGSIKLSAYTFTDATGTLDPPASAEGVKQSVSITSPGQVGRYSVEMKAGDKVSLRTDNSNMTGGYEIRWVNPSGSSVYSVGFAAKENWFWDSKTFSTAGTWTLVVDPNGANTGSVDLTLWETPDKTGQTITPSTEGGSVTSTISLPGQRELVTFSGSGSQLITLKAQESTIANGSMWILKPDGSQLSGSTVNFSSGSSSKIEATLPSTGTYTVVVDPPSTGSNATANGTGSVKATVYLGSHAAWLGSPPTGLQLVRFPLQERSVDEGLQISYSDAPAGPRREPSSGKKPVGSLGQRKNVNLSSQLRHTWSPAKRGGWLPPKPGSHRNWLIGRSSSPWLDVAPLEAPDGTTALSGQALRVDGLPIAEMPVSIEGSPVSAKTDRAGRFLLQGAPSGHHVLRIGGESVPGGERYGTYEVGVDLAREETTPLDYTVWLTPLDSAGDLTVESPTKHAASLRTPRVPGLEVKIPAGTTITDDQGHPVKDLNITAIPLDRPPFPLPPFVRVPVYFTVQPGGARLSKGARFVYPNWGDMAPGARVEFWNYDPDDRGWYVYGHGTVTPDGTRVVPDRGVRVWEFTGAMSIDGPTPPITFPGPFGDLFGDPVDPYSGLFVYHKTDLTLPDTIPLSIQRTYRPNDSNSYSFGAGMTNLYDLRLWPIVNYKQADLIFPDGARVHYARTSPGTGWADAVYEPTGAAGPFSASTISWNGSSWDLKMTNGITFTFGGFAPLIAIKDRHGNKLTIKRVGGQLGNIKEIVSPNGRWAKFTYDGSNRITDITDNGGRHLKYSYTSGRLTKVEGLAGRTTEYEYDASGRMKAVINARGNKYLQNAYDANGRVEKQTMGDGGTFEFDYDLDEAGKVKAATLTDPLGSGREVVFDSEGFVTSETVAPGTALAQTRSYERQPETGLILSATDNLGHETEYEYDNSANVTEVTRMAGTEDAVTTAFKYEPGTTNLTKVTDPLGHSTEFTYGSQGELLSKKDALGHKTEFSYNSRGEPVSVVSPEGEETSFGYELGDLISMTDPLDRTTRRFVDSLGRVRAVTTPGGHQTRYAYNDADEVTKVTSPSWTETDIAYDADGNVTAVTDPLEHKTTRSYDAMDRVVAEIDPLENETTWTYDKAGDVVAEEDRNGTTSTFSYDALRRLTEAQYGVVGEGADSAITYEYDGLNRLIGVDDTDAGEYTLDYDDLNRLLELSGPDGAVGYTYDDAGRRATLLVSDLDPLLYEFDDADRLVHLSRSSDEVSLAYDKADRLEQVTLPNDLTQSYEYDEAGEPISIAYENGEEGLGAINYAYDKDGLLEAMWGSYARLSLPQALKSTEYNNANQLVNREGVTLEYDGEGNLLSDGSREYTWDSRGQLASIGGSTTAAFAYDPFGRRISKTLGGTTTNLLHDGPNVVRESVEAELTAGLITGLKPDQIFARTTGEGTSSYLTDRLGSTVALADEAGEVSTSYSYDPFGVPTSSGVPSDNPYQFTGREDDGTGLQYNRARYYSPLQGRFISQDPAGFEGSGSNLYWYANSDPVDYVDPTGEYTEPGGFSSVGGPSSEGSGVSSNVLDFMESMYERAESQEQGPWKPDFENPSKPPGPGWEWRGKGPPGSGEGSWYKPGTGESLHPDPDTETHGEHQDYEPKDGSGDSRIYPDGRMEPKNGPKRKKN
jgi:RHS repeat-associated protein